MKTATIRMKTNDITEVLVYDQIGRDSFFGDGISAKEFRDQVRAIKTGIINLRINSPGGSVTEAAAMLTALDEHPARIEVSIDGLAALAASVIAMAGDKIAISPSALVMIHNPHTVAMGGAEELRRTADVLDKVRGQILDAYQRKSNKTREELAAMMDAETWFTGAEAVDAGLADELMSNSPAIAASADLSKFGYRKVPSAISTAWQEHKRRIAIAAKL